MKEQKICKETAQALIGEWLDKWGFEDPKEIVSGGKESSIPEDMQATLLAAVMRGRLEFHSESITYELTKPVFGKEGEIKQVKIPMLQVTNKMVRQYNIAEGVSLDQAQKVIEMYTGLTNAQFADMNGRDTSVLLAVATYLAFT